MTSAITEAQAVLDAGTALAKPTAVDGKALAYVIPEGHTIETIDTDLFAANPRRKKGIALPATVDALINYVTRHVTPQTTLWVHPTSGRVVAILDDHHGEGDPATSSSPSLAGHGEHRAVLSLQHTPEWKFWTDLDGSTFQQAEFAEHIEDGAKEIVDPSPATLLEIASTFQAKKDVQFRQGTRLDNGTVQLQYDEVLAASAGRSGSIEIPQTFKLAIAPFIGEPAYAVTARLRYRLSGGKLTLSYHLERPHDVVRDALDGVAKRLDSEFDNVYTGEPRT